MSSVQVQLGGNSVQVQVQSSGFARANAAIKAAAASATAAAVSETNAAASAAAAAAQVGVSLLKAQNLADLPSASTARTNLGVAIGTNVQAYSANLDEYAAVNPTAAGLALLDDADASAQRTTLGLGTMATQPASAVAITGGAITGITDLAVADGGTGASTASVARDNLGLTIGTNVQAYDADLTAIAALTSAADKMPYATGAQTWALADLTAAGRALLDDVDAAAQRTTLAAVGTAALAASTGAALVGSINTGTGATARTVQAKMQDTLSFADFGAVGDNSTDDTTAIGLAITAAAARAATGGVQARVSGVPGKTYKVTAAIALATFVDIDLNGSEVVQYTANTPVFSAPGTDIQQWSLRNGTLSYNTAQTSGQTSGIGLRTANGANSYMFEVSNLDIRDACKGVAAPTTAGTFTFLGSFTNVRVLDAADWSWEILCNSGAGANTNLSFTNVWAVQTGTPKAASKGFKVIALSQGRFNSMAVDHVALQAFNFESCTGDWGCLSIESCDFVGPVEPVVFFESPGTVASLKFIDNTYTSTGGDIYMLRPGCIVTGYLQVDSFIESGGVFTGANTYEVNPTSGMRIVNNYASTSRSPVFADFGIRRKIIRWNGVDLMRIFGGGQVEVFTTTVPTSEEWLAGDTATNTAPAAGGTPGWKCTTAGRFASAWTISTAYAPPQDTFVTNDGGKVYKLTTAGTSAGSGGPTGTGTGIADGTCVWAYYGVLPVFKAMANLAA